MSSTAIDRLTMRLNTILLLTPLLPQGTRSNVVIILAAQIIKKRNDFAALAT